MKPWQLLLVGLLLFAACHHNDTSQPEERGTAPSKMPADTVRVPVPVDTIPVPPRHSSTFTLQQDSAERVDFSLFRRKQRVIYDPALIVGEWIRGSEHEQYTADGKGCRWDPGEDIQREEAQDFTWTMDSNMLMFKFRLNFGALVVREYMVTFVDDETLVYQSAYGDSYMWEKVPSVSHTDSIPAAEGN